MVRLISTELKINFFLFKFEVKKFNLLFSARRSQVSLSVLPLLGIIFSRINSLCWLPFMLKALFFICSMVFWPLLAGFTSSRLSSSCSDSLVSVSLPLLLLLLELSLELSDCTPMSIDGSTLSAISTKSGRTFLNICLFGRFTHQMISGWQTFNILYHFFASFGRPRIVLFQTTGKFWVEQKFCVTATVSVRLSTTCHQPPVRLRGYLQSSMYRLADWVLPGTNIVSPGRCRTSILME